jgi:serralysin
MATPLVIDTEQTATVVLTANDSDLTVNAPITVTTQYAKAIDLSAGAGGQVNIFSAVTADDGIWNESATVYNLRIREGASLRVTYGFTIRLSHGGSTILNDGIIAGDIRLNGGGATVITNNGAISSPNSVGIYFRSALSIDNIITNTGTITGHDAGLWMEGTGTVLTNSGTIEGLNNAIRFVRGNHTVVNSGTITSPDTRNAIRGGSGDETIINTGTINGNVFLGEGNDSLDNRQGTINGIIRLWDGDDTFLGGMGDETISHLQGDDSIEGGTGRDTVTYESYTASDMPATVDLRIAAVQNTGWGNDILIGVENLIGTGGDDVFTGNDSDNLLNGAGGSDNLAGGNGNDTLEGGLGNDLLQGGDGADTAVFSGTDRVVADLNLVATQNTGYGDDRLADIENVTSGEGDDRLRGNASANVLTGNGGVDILSGRAGDDILNGGDGDDILKGEADDDTLRGDAGDDLLLGGSGHDRLDGGAGNDTLIGSADDVAVLSVASTAYTSVRNDDGSFTITSQNGVDELQGIRFAQFSDKTVALSNAAPAGLALSRTSVAEDTLATAIVATLAAQDADGDALSYSLTSNPGGLFRLDGTSLVLLRALDYETAQQHTIAIKAQDAYGGEVVTTLALAVSNVVETTPLRLAGTAAANRLTGEAGNDLLFGLGGADTLRGEAGNDKLYGGLGRDMLSGGTGKDIFVFDSKLNPTTDLDRILDFRVADDTIHLSKKIFSKIAKKGVVAKEAFWVGDKAHDESDRLVYNKKTGALLYDPDGNGALKAVQFATLPKSLAPTHLDFFVI